MRQYPKYQTICDYAPTISHAMSVTHDIKRCETPMQKLQEIIASLTGEYRKLRLSLWWELFFIFNNGRRDAKPVSLLIHIIVI